MATFRSTSVGIKQIEACELIARNCERKAELDEEAAMVAKDLEGFLSESKRLVGLMQSNTPAASDALGIWKQQFWNNGEFLMTPIAASERHTKLAAAYAKMDVRVVGAKPHILHSLLMVAYRQLVAVMEARSEP